MPTLICDLRPQAAALLPEYEALQAAGESLALLWPASASAAADLEAVEGAAALQAAFDDQRLVMLRGGTPPAWLPLDDFHRVLLIAAGPELTTAERVLAAALLAAGCEAVEVLRPADACDLAQSWFSGRRTGTRLLR